MPTAIEFNNISKLYRLGLVSSGTLSHDIQRWWQMNILGKEDPFLKVGSVNDRSTAADSEYVWALKDIDFKVEQGDVVGIIGKNGAGKSTLLKLLSRVTGPTTGTIKAKGRIGSLLEVGTGFHSEMTGRENIYMNGAILGMTKAEITSKLDEIVDFSGCERYIDTPVKRYSSGMMVRLGFAVAAHLDPEILVVDEVLAVGDAEFQKKAIGKMQDVSRGEGRTVLFVSHNMGSIRQLCQHGVLLDKGTVAMSGDVNDVVDQYLANSYEMKSPVWKKTTINPAQTGQLVSAEIKDMDGNIRSKFVTNEDVVLDLQIQIRKAVPGTYGYLDVLRVRDGMKVFVSDSNDVDPKKLDRLHIGMNRVRVVFPKYLFAPGTYLTGINLNSAFAEGNDEFIDRAQYVVGFEVHDYSTQRGDRREGFSSKLLDWALID